MTDPPAPRSNEAAAATTPTTTEGQRALIEHLAQAVVGTPQSPRRTASDTGRAAAVPLLYTELYKENPFSQEMAPAPAPFRMAPRPDVPTDGSSYKNRAASSPDLEPLQEIESLSSDHELPPPMDIPSNPSHAVISRKERNGLKMPTQADMAACNSGKLSGNGTSANRNGHTDAAGKATGARTEPFDPQRAYPSEACIFVANLLEGAADEKLAEALTFLFGRYGTVFVKIKRKANNMPYAFVQFTTIKDAVAAMKGAKGARVLDRVCRMEPANSKRFWLVNRADGKRSSVAEVREALEGQGTSSIQEAQPMILEALGIDHGIRVEFPQWDQSRDLRRTISSRFVAEPLDEFAITRRQNGGTAAAQARLRKTTADDSEAKGSKTGAEGKTPAEGSPRWSFMERYDRDRRSVFCGNLPSNVTEGELRQVFGRTGGFVKGLEIIKCAHSAYAFIEFNRADVYETTIELLNGSDLRGMSMKIERRRARVPGASPNPFQGHRCATLPHRPGGLASQREPHNFTPLPSPGHAQVGLGTNFQQAHNGNIQPARDEAGNGPPAPVTGAATQGQAFGSPVQQNSAQYINYLRYLLSAQQHAQVLHAAQGLHGGQPPNGQHNGDAIQGLHGTGAQAASQSPERVAPMAENGSGVGAGATMVNPFAVPYPLLSPNGGVFPNGVPFVGMPYGSPITPTYPITPAHLLGAGNPVGHGRPAANGVDRPLGVDLDAQTGTALGQLPPNVISMLSRSSGLTDMSSMNDGVHALGRPSAATPAAANGMASHPSMQGAIPDQNGVQQRINAPNAPGQGLNGGPNRGSH